MGFHEDDRIRHKNREYNKREARKRSIEFAKTLTDEKLVSLLMIAGFSKEEAEETVKNRI